MPHLNLPPSISFRYMFWDIERRISLGSYLSTCRSLCAHDHAVRGLFEDQSTPSLYGITGCSGGFGTMLEFRGKQAAGLCRSILLHLCSKGICPLNYPLIQIDFEPLRSRLVPAHIYRSECGGPLESKYAAGCTDSSTKIS